MIPLSLAIVIDDRYALYAGQLLKSLAMNKKADYDYCLSVLYNNLSDKSIKYVEDTYHTLFADGSIRFHYIDMSKYVGVMSTNWHLTNSAYLKFYIPSMTKEFAKTLYLDIDCIVDGDILPIFEYDLSGKYLAAVGDWGFNHIYDLKNLYGPNYLGVPASVSYFNTGVILFNNAYCNEKGLLDKCLKNLETIRKPTYMDQDILNSVCCRDFVLLPDRFNVQYDNQKPNNGCADIVVHHYLGASKIWLTPNSRESLRWAKYRVPAPLAEHHAELPQRVEYRLSSSLFGNWTTSITVKNDR